MAAVAVVVVVDVVRERASGVGGGAASVGFVEPESASNRRLDDAGREGDGAGCKGDDAGFSGDAAEGGERGERVGGEAIGDKEVAGSGEAIGKDAGASFDDAGNVEVRIDVKLSPLLRSSESSAQPAFNVDAAGAKLDAGGKVDVGAKADAGAHPEAPFV